MITGPSESDSGTLTSTTRPYPAGIWNFPAITDEAEEFSWLLRIPMFRTAVERAITQKELPAKIDVDLAVGTLISLFFGTPLWGTRIRPQDIGATYAAQLTTLWEGLRCVKG